MKKAAAIISTRALPPPPARTNQTTRGDQRSRLGTGAAPFRRHPRSRHHHILLHYRRQVINSILAWCTSIIPSSSILLRRRRSILSSGSIIEAVALHARSIRARKYVSSSLFFPLIASKKLTCKRTGLSCRMDILRRFEAYDLAFPCWTRGF